MQFNRFQSALFLFSSAFLFLVCLIPVAHAQEANIKVHRTKNPVMRVKVGDALPTTTFTASKRFIIEDTARLRLMVVEPGQNVDVTYLNGQYIVTSGATTIVSALPVRITPLRLNHTITVANFENRPAWNPSINDNQFFGSIEVVYSAQSTKTLLVNVIGIENYVKGIAEAGNENDADYLQALLTAARTYAYFNIEHCTKFPGEPYCLDSSANSQVYRGAGFTKRAPNIVAAAKATKRQVIMYEGSPIVAPYFSQSDGHTRSWAEVWNGAQPWAVSVDDPGCVGLQTAGHGVGMSARGARYFAEQGWTWDQILKYYYQGVELAQYR